jgi:hypothetical protein
MTNEALVEVVAQRLKATPHDMLTAEPYTVAKAIVADLNAKISDDNKRLTEGVNQIEGIAGALLAGKWTT